MDDFETVRREADPIKQARDATALLNLYQQRGHELARLRREAINRAAQETGATYADLAKLVGISKARVTQLRQSGPPSERAFFGVGPIDVAVPLRGIPGRPAGGVAAEDAEAQRIMSDLLQSLSFDVRPVTIPNGDWTPDHEAVVICGPKSSHVSAGLIAHDPHLAFNKADGRWQITTRDTGEAFTSPLDDGRDSEDVAYVGRITRAGRTTLVIAGVHALGSVGAASHLRTHLPLVHAQVGIDDFSMVIRATFDGLTPLTTEAAWGPIPHP